MDLPVRERKQLPVLRKDNGSKKSSGGFFSKDGRTKVNAAIEKYNKATLSSNSTRLTLLLEIYLALDDWEKRLISGNPKKHTDTKLEQIRCFRLTLLEEKGWLENGSGALSRGSIDLIKPDPFELEPSYSARNTIIIDNECGSHSAKRELPSQLFNRGVDFTGMDQWDQQSEPLVNLCKHLESKNILLSSANDSAISIENAQALLDFFKSNPGLLDAFQNGGILSGLLKEISLEDYKGDGGGVYDSNNRIVRTNPGEAKKESFMRIIVHELGHASLQRLLQVDDNGIGTQEGLQLEKAFNTIKQNKRYFFGVDLGEYSKQEFGRNRDLQSRTRPRDPQSRQGYQSDALKEFIAESFMHLALMPDELAEHVQRIFNDSLVPQEVKTAWKSVIGILNQFGQQILVLPSSWTDWASKV